MIRHAIRQNIPKYVNDSHLKRDFYLQWVVVIVLVMVKSTPKKKTNSKNLKLQRNYLLGKIHVFQITGKTRKFKILKYLRLKK